MVELVALGLSDDLGSSLGGPFAIPSFLANRQILKFLPGLFFFGLFAVCALASSTDNYSLLLLIPGCPAAVIAGGYLYYRYTRSWVGPTQIFASEARLRRGALLDIVIKQEALRDILYDSIKVQIGMREWVRYRCGTNTCTDSYDQIVCNYETFETVSVMQQESLNHKVSFNLPNNLMHAFQESDNRLSWFVCVKIDVKGLPETAQYYKIELDTETH